MSEIVGLLINARYTIEHTKDFFSPGDIVQGIVHLFNGNPNTTVQVKDILTWVSFFGKNFEKSSIKDNVKLKPGNSEDVPFKITLPVWTDITNLCIEVHFRYLVDNRVHVIEPPFIVPVSGTVWRKKVGENQQKYEMWKDKAVFVEEEVPKSELKGLTNRDIMMRGWFVCMSGASGKWEGSVRRKVRVKSLQEPQEDIKLPWYFPLTPENSATIPSHVENAPAPAAIKSAIKEEVPQMIACPSCGTQLPQGARFCNKCGTKQ